jgi:serine protease Do
VNELPLDRVEDFRRTLKGLPPGRTVALLVMRDLRMAYVPVRVPRTRTGPPD